PCIYYRLRKYRRKHRSGSSTSSWVLVSDVSSDRVPFLLQDETGTVTVDPKGASIAGIRREGSGGIAPHFLVTGEAFHGDEKWVEEIIYEGTSLYVLGMARPRREAGSTLREKTALALRRLKGDRQAMQRYDADGDGTISPEEWEDARADVERKILHQSLAEGGGRKRQEEHLEIARPTPRSLPFLIAETASEERLTRKYNIFSVVLFVGAVVCAAWALHAFFKTFIHS
ncbi:MAG TPA: GIDE domain-containing protein, partial [Candidatus Krumholzibacterium sp.]|nr:GIDE domain-containing protein [Candidatus Krumholzibacterium sp.]